MARTCSEINLEIDDQRWEVFLILEDLLIAESLVIGMKPPIAMLRALTHVRHCVSPYSNVRNLLGAKSIFFLKISESYL